MSDDSLRQLERRYRQDPTDDVVVAAYDAALVRNGEEGLRKPLLERLAAALAAGPEAEIKACAQETYEAARKLFEFPGPRPGMDFLVFRPVLSLLYSCVPAVQQMSDYQLRQLAEFFTAHALARAQSYALVSPVTRVSAACRYTATTFLHLILIEVRDESIAGREAFNRLVRLTNIEYAVVLAGLSDDAGRLDRRGLEVVEGALNAGAVPNGHIPERFRRALFDPLAPYAPFAADDPRTQVRPL